MTENDIFNKLWSYLDKINRETSLINPEWVLLTEIIRSHQSSPRPSQGPYMTIQLLADKDSGLIECDDYQDIELDGDKRAVLSRKRGWEWLFRIEIYSRVQTDHLKTFSTALRTQFASVDMHPVAIKDVSDIKTAPALVQGGWEGRAYLDLTLGSVFVSKMLVDTIDEGCVLINEPLSEIQLTATYKR